MLDMEEIRQALQDRRISVVAEVSGVNRNLIGKIRSGEVTEVTRPIQNSLSNYLCSPYQEGKK